VVYNYNDAAQIEALWKFLYNTVDLSKQDAQDVMKSHDFKKVEVRALQNAYEEQTRHQNVYGSVAKKKNVEAALESLNNWGGNKW